MRRNKWLWIGAIALVVLIVVYVNQVYFFNPLTFEQDEVTYLPWNWYKKPLQIEYLVMGPNGWQQKIVDDDAEIRFVIDEIRKGAHRLPAYAGVNGLRDEQRVIIDIRHPEDGTNAPGGIVLHAEWTVGHDALLSGSNKMLFVVTQELRQLMEKRMGQAMEEEHKQ